jgi:hypothetical protein
MVFFIATGFQTHRYTLKFIYKIFNCNQCVYLMFELALSPAHPEHPEQGGTTWNTRNSGALQLKASRFIADNHACLPKYLYFEHMSFQTNRHGKSRQYFLKAISRIAKLPFLIY